MEEKCKCPKCDNEELVIEDYDEDISLYSSGIMRSWKCKCNKCGFIGYYTEEYAPAKWAWDDEDGEPISNGDFK